VNVTIYPSGISGTVKAPASKSSMQRACAAALLHHGSTVINHPGHSNDDNAAVELIQQMGAVVGIEPDRLIIQSNGVKPIGNLVNCGESGLGIRMFAPIVALCEQTVLITGEGSLLKRPMDFFDEVFPKLGVEVESNHGKLPIKVKGPLQPRNIKIDGSLSSQFLTGLLMAYSASGATDVSIKVKNLKSKPYIDLTLDVMKKFGFNIPVNNNYDEFGFSGDLKVLSGTRTYTVEGDWSGGAFLLVAGAIAGHISIEGLDIASTQADKAILTAIRQAGAVIEIQSNSIEIEQPIQKLKAFHFDATECPDLFPPLVSLAAYCGGRSFIQGVSRLTHKESNRAVTLQEEFGKLGVHIELKDDIMIIDGGNGVTGNKVHSHHDHRIAMACAVAALKATGNTEIEEADAINKSYPDFYRDIEKLGAAVQHSFIASLKQ